jgi:tmRNA-binding protein
MYEYNAYVLEVHETDLVKCSIRLGFGVFSVQKVRLANIYIPDTTTRQDLSKQKLTDLILHKEIIIKTFKETKSNPQTIYNADIYIETKAGIVCVNDWLVSNKFANYMEETDE